MKRNLLKRFGRMTAAVMALMLMPLTAMADVEISEANFPDQNFRQWLLEQDYGQDGVLTVGEINGITKISVGNMGISSLQGIEYFTALTDLSCYNNQLTKLDVSKNTALIALYCSGNQLTALDVSQNTALIVLTCYNNQLTELDVSKNTALMSLDCYENQLTVLDVSKNTKLGALDCDDNQLTELDVSGCTALQDLNCYHNQLTELDISKNTALKRLNCMTNQLSTLDVSSNKALQRLKCGWNKFTELDVSVNTALQELECGGNQLTTLDVSANTALQKLICDRNQQLTTLDVSANKELQWLDCSYIEMTTLDVSNNKALQRLECYGNPLAMLDVSANTALQILTCCRNQLTTLDVSKNTELQRLDCSENQLTTLDVSKNTTLQRLQCYQNQLRGEGMDALIASLSEVESAELIVFCEDYEPDGNVCTKTNVADARAKGWTVYYYNSNWEKKEYEGVEPVNVDSERHMLHTVDIDGVTYALYKQVVDGYDVRVDPDGKKSYRSKLSLDVKKDGQTATYDIDDELYFSAGTDYRSDLQAMQFEMDSRQIFIFTQSATKTNPSDYTYDGFAYISPMDDISFKKETAYTDANQGFYSRFIDIRNGRIAVTHYKYLGYCAMTSIRDTKGRWTTWQGNTNIPDWDYEAVWNRMGENVLLKGEGYSELNDELYQAAMDAIKASLSTRYYIYTIYDTPEGPKKYYLTKEGKLVEWAKVKANDRFYFTKVNGSNLYATPGLVMNIRFSNPKPDNGGATGNIVPQGHLLVETNYKRNDWEGQVWFKKGDCFAVRATNALSLMWGADTYWCTLDSNGDGEPEADYGLTPSFVWYLENPNADSIDDIENESDQADTPIYDLSGRRLQGQPVQKGIYLRNGKKILYK